MSTLDVNVREYEVDAAPGAPIHWGHARQIGNDGHDEERLPHNAARHLYRASGRELNSRLHH